MILRMQPAEGGVRIVRYMQRYCAPSTPGIGKWIAHECPLPPGWRDIFSEEAAQAMLPLLEELDRCLSRGTRGRPRNVPSSPDARRLIEIFDELGLASYRVFAEILGISDSAFSKAVNNGVWPKLLADAESVLKLHREGIVVHEKAARSQYAGSTAETRP